MSFVFGTFIFICVPICVIKLNQLSLENLDHLAQQIVDFFFTVTEVTAIDVMVVLLAPATGWCV